MKITDVGRIATTNLSGNVMRTALTVMGIGVGIATIVFLVSLGYGLQDLSIKRIASIGAVSTINISAGKIAAPDKDLATKYKTDPRVDKVVPVSSVPIKASMNGKSLDGVSGVVSGDFFDMEGVKAEAGDLYKSGDTKSVVVSTGLAKGFDMPIASMIGKDIELQMFVKDPSANTVKTITENFKVMGSYLDDSTIAAYTSDDILSQTGDLPVTQIKVKVNDQKEIPTMKTELENAGYSATSVADTIGQLDTIFKIVQIVLAIFGGVALIVASIGMFNTMTIALLERTRDVGIMKATGTEDTAVYLIFLSEAVLISVLGGLSGLILGWISTIVVNWSVNRLASSVGGETVDLFTTPINFIVLMLSFSFLVGFSTGFLPARRASKLNPLEALRYE